MRERVERTSRRKNRVRGKRGEKEHKLWGCRYATDGRRFIYPAKLQGGRRIRIVSLGKKREEIGYLMGGERRRCRKP